MENAERSMPNVEPVRKHVVVGRRPEEAFEIFTERFGTWWPYRQFSINQADTQSCAIDGRIGGLVYEVSRAGERAVWGTILEWDPPRRFVMSWHPGRTPETAQEVEVRFTAVADGTRVDLEHRKWETLGADAARTKKDYQNGWAVVFEQRFAEACR